MIYLIWAQTPAGVIGKDNKLPWSIKQEMQHFKATTIHKTVVMGAKTFVSLPSNGLPERTCYVLTRDVSKYALYQKDNLYFIDKIDDLIAEFKDDDTQELYVIGGKEIYNLFLPYAKALIVSIIKQEYEGDVYMTPIDWSNWQLSYYDEFEEFTVKYYERV